MKNYTQRVLIIGSLSGLEGCVEWAFTVLCLVLLLFSIFVNDLDDGKERLLIKPADHITLKCCKDAGEQEQEFKRILTNWKNDGNTRFFMALSVHFPTC